MSAVLVGFYPTLLNWSLSATKRPNFRQRIEQNVLAGLFSRIAGLPACTGCLLAGDTLHRHLPDPDTYLPNHPAASPALSRSIQKFSATDHRNRSLVPSAGDGSNDASRDHAPDAPARTA
ncbi:MAG TPA: hypothetical protein VHL50_04200, partial [Pyrinomonadaceae bacterium]|nr:hypothetical protein [Pyrinomonadaceae bacterium]